MSLTIRPAAPDDFEQWKTLWAGYNEFYGRSGPTALSDDIFASTWRRFLDPAELLQCLVAEEAGRLLGLAHFIFHPNTITIEPTCLFARPFHAP